MEEYSLLTPDSLASYSVSSVLNKNSKDYGKQHLFDGDQQTCWNSGQASTHSIKLKFDNHYHIARIELITQGGFSPSIMKLLNGEKQLCSFEVEDINTRQSFDVNVDDVSELKIVMQGGRDFYGRTVVYCLQVYGK